MAASFIRMNGHALKVAVDRDRVWVGTEGGLGLYENGVWKRYAIEDEEREGDPPTEERRQQLAKDLKKAIAGQGMLLVTQACASCGAKARGIDIPGNLVFGVFRNDYAVRMLDADIGAGIEAPVRFYLTERPDGTAALSWKTPTSIFAPYGNAELDAARNMGLPFPGTVAATTGTTTSCT